MGNMGFYKLSVFQVFCHMPVAGDKADCKYHCHAINVKIMLTSIDDFTELIGSAGSQKVDGIGDGRAGIKPLRRASAFSHQIGNFYIVGREYVGQHHGRAASGLLWPSCVL